MNRQRTFAVAVLAAALTVIDVGGTVPAGYSQTAREPSGRLMERLGRGVVAVKRKDGSVYVGWRMLLTDREDIAFNVYVASGQDAPVKLNGEPIVASTNFIDPTGDLSRSRAYFVRGVVLGRELEPSAHFVLPAGSPVQEYLSVPLKTLAGYTANDAAVGDLNGDGEYEIIIKQEMRGYDNSQRGVCPGTTKLEAYKRDGTLLWRIDLGKNIREGAHYTPFIVYDLDGDGSAEIAVRTAEGTVDGVGNTIGDSDGDGVTDHVNAQGYILEGPEFLSIFDGRTGKELARTSYIARGRVADWGDDYGNRVDRFLMGVGYFDGVRPSVVMCRGYYTITRLQAWNWRDGRLTHVWSFDSRSRGEFRKFEGQGNHNLSIGDVDHDGKDEIVYGAMCLDDDGKPLYSTGLGHGDAIHLSDIDPDRPGLEVFDIHERPRHANGAEFRDARTGALIWGKASPDVGRGVAMDVDPRHKGYEMWASGRGLSGLWNAKGETIAERKPRSCNFGVWWDGDLLREILDRTTISKWNWQDQTETTLIEARGCASNNGTKATPCLCADILGDWREEVVFRTTDSRELRIYTTTIPTEHRLYTLMHDPIYRISVALQNVGYNQPAQPGFYLGDGMKAQPRPTITTGPPRTRTAGLATADRPKARLADIGPAPATALLDSDEKPFDLAKLKGKVVLVSFVYTTCTGVCPMITQALVGVEKKLQETKLWGTSVEFVSITLDPKRDTPRVLRDYAALFKADPKAWHFLTGSSAEVNEVIAAWDMWVKSDPTGVLDHPSRIFLIDSRGRQREIYNLEFLKADVVVDDVRGLIDEK